MNLCCVPLFKALTHTSESYSLILWLLQGPQWLDQGKVLSSHLIDFFMRNTTMGEVSRQLGGWWFVCHSAVLWEHTHCSASLRGYQEGNCTEQTRFQLNQQSRASNNLSFVRSKTDENGLLMNRPHHCSSGQTTGSDKGQTSKTILTFCIWKHPAGTSI